MAEPAWYLVFAGSSCDGRGTPSFKKRTFDREEAVASYRAYVCSPYAFGHVIEVTDSTYKHLHLSHLNG
jgi:hypothetical protein